MFATQTTTAARTTVTTPFARRAARAAALLGLALAGPLGCAAGYNLNVALSPEFAKSLGDEKVYVHVVGVNPNDRQQLEAMSVRRYWRYDEDAAPAAGDGAGGAADEPVREQDTAMLELSARKPSATVAESDPLWARWRDKGSSYVMVLASRPLDVAGVASGGPDPRRRFLPFSRDAWREPNVNVQVTGGGLRVQTGLRSTAAASMR